MELVNGFSKNEVLASFSSKVLELIILPTEQCNFRCTYCYEDFEIGKMPDGIVTGIKNLLAKRIPSLKRLSISWFGGEPLLQQRIILDIASFAHKLCLEHDVVFSGGFTTNGYKLTPDLMRRFCELNQVGYQITLDGDEDTHNLTRVFKDGKSTFSQIWSNLINLRNSEIQSFNITLRIHLTIHNFESVKSLVRRVKTEFGKDKRFNIHFHKISDLGGPNKVDVLSYDVYMERLVELDKILSGDLVYDTEYEKKDKVNYICYAAKPNSLLIRANGRIGKCTVAFSSDKNDLGEILPSGEVVIDNEKLKPWMRGFETLDASVLGCPVQSVHSSSRENTIDIVEVN